MSDDTFAEHVSAKTLGLVNSILSPGDVTKLCSEKTFATTLISVSVGSDLLLAPL